MKAMLLAAGLGTRLKPLTDQVPKCMIPISGKPLLEWNIEWLKKFGIIELLINLHYLPGVIPAYFGDGRRWDVNISYSLEDEILGTAGGVKKVAGFFNDERFLVWYGDNLSTCDLAKLQAFHHAKNGLASIALYERPDVSQSGIVELDNQSRVLRFLEKPAPDQVFSHWVNAGIYILEPEMLDLIPDHIQSDFSRQIFPALLVQNRPFYGYRMSAAEGLWWIDTLADLDRTQAQIHQKLT